MGIKICQPGRQDYLRKIKIGARKSMPYKARIPGSFIKPPLPDTPEKRV
jgi:hypothetical protein